MDLPAKDMTITKFDPWGPVSTALFSNRDSDLVQDLVGFGGLVIAWPDLDPNTDGRSNPSRIRAYRPLIQQAYIRLPEDEKGRFAKSSQSDF